ncbi:hypothetical protein B296_00036029 [Ensete ventricosum]|uniref:Argonaut glycine-rich domain-containing protein n=1 Tax=Ensete ventricosum TaxID=4639 RepID=A0A426YP54_ENSVE|nr:hypothetical protein B296_00036029 [Ensete ventricosum]
MVRKRRTELPGSGESSETRQSIGSSHPAVPTHWLETNPTSQQQRAAAGRGSVPSNPHLPQQAGRGSAGYQGHGGWRPHGVPAPQQPGAPAQGYRVRGGPLPGGAMPPQQQHGVWQVSGSVPGRSGVSPAAAGPSRPPAPELHQAMQAPYQVAQASSQGRSPWHHETSTAQSATSFEQLSVQDTAASSQDIQPVVSQPSSSKSIRFPLRPGKGSSGVKCVVKANHFLAELPDRDLHQYDVVIRFAARADLHHLEMFLTGRQPDAPQDALQVLDIVLRELPTAR